MVSVPITVLRHLGNTPMANAARMNVAAMNACGLVTSDMAFRKDTTHPLVYHHSNPGEPLGLYQADFKIGYWVWEVRDYLPDSWLEESKEFHQIWTPSKFSANALMRGGIEEGKVRIIPCYSTYGRMAAPPVNEHKFLCVVASSDTLRRENPWDVIEAFKAAFPDRQDVRLTIKATSLSANDSGQFQRRMATDRRITLLEGGFDDYEMKNLFLSHHTFVSLHRSVGFGSIILDAMAAGLTVVTTLSGGNREFCNEDTCLPVDSSNVAAYNKGEPGGTWGTPNIEHAASQMRHAKETGRSARSRQRVMRAYQDCIVRYNFLTTCNAISNAITSF